MTEKKKINKKVINFWWGCLCTVELGFLTVLITGAMFLVGVLLMKVMPTDEVAWIVIFGCFSTPIYFSLRNIHYMVEMEREITRAMVRNKKEIEKMLKKKKDKND